MPASHTERIISSAWSDCSLLTAPLVRKDGPLVEIRGGSFLPPKVILLQRNAFHINCKPMSNPTTPTPVSPFRGVSISSIIGKPHEPTEPSDISAPSPFSVNTASNEPRRPSERKVLRDQQHQLEMLDLALYKAHKAGGFLGALFTPFVLRARAILARLDTIEHFLAELLGERRASAENQDLAEKLAALEMQSAAMQTRLRQEADSQEARAKSLRNTLEEILHYRTLIMTSRVCSGATLPAEAVRDLEHMEQRVRDVVKADSDMFDPLTPHSSELELAPSSAVTRHLASREKRRRRTNTVVHPEPKALPETPEENAQDPK